MQFQCLCIVCDIFRLKRSTGLYGSVDRVYIWGRVLPYRPRGSYVRTQYVGSSRESSSDWSTEYQRLWRPVGEAYVYMWDGGVWEGVNLLVARWQTAMGCLFLQAITSVPAHERRCERVFAVGRPLVSGLGRGGWSWVVSTEAQHAGML